MSNREEILHFDEYFMEASLKEARNALSCKEVPVGAVVVMSGTIVGRGHNLVITHNDPTAHAEMMALKDASKHIGNYRMNECTLYVTVEPCIMCAGAIVHSRLKTLVYGVEDAKWGGVHSLYTILSDRRLNHTLEVRSGILHDKCKKIIRQFFNVRRQENYRLRRGTEVAVTGSTRNRLGG